MPLSAICRTPKKPDEVILDQKIVVLCRYACPEFAGLFAYRGCILLKLFHNRLSIVGFQFTGRPPLNDSFYI